MNETLAISTRVVEGGVEPSFIKDAEKPQIDSSFFIALVRRIFLLFRVDEFGVVFAIRGFAFRFVGFRSRFFVGEFGFGEEAKGRNDVKF